jgi:hypothetical protein
MVQRATQREPQRRGKTTFIDCDIHNTPPSISALYPYMSERWRKHTELFGMRVHHGFAAGHPLSQGQHGERFAGRRLAAVRFAARRRSRLHAGAAPRRL